MARSLGRTNTCLPCKGCTKGGSLDVDGIQLGRPCATPWRRRGPFVGRMRQGLPAACEGCHWPSPLKQIPCASMSRACFFLGRPPGHMVIAAACEDVSQRRRPINGRRTARADRLHRLFGNVLEAGVLGPQIVGSRLNIPRLPAPARSMRSLGLAGAAGSRWTRRVDPSDGCTRDDHQRRSGRDAGVFSLN